MTNGGSGDLFLSLVITIMGIASSLVCYIGPFVPIAAIIFMMVRKKHKEVRVHPRVVGRGYAYLVLYTSMAFLILGMILTTKAMVSTVTGAHTLFYTVTVDSKTKEKIVDRCVNKYNCKEYEVNEMEEGRCGRCFRDEAKNVATVDKEMIAKDFVRGVSLVFTSLFFFGVHYIAVRIFEKGFNREASFIRKVYLFSGAFEYALISVIVLLFSIYGVFSKIFLNEWLVIGVPIGVWVVSTIFILPVWLYFFIAVLRNARAESLTATESTDSKMLEQE